MLNSIFVVLLAALAAAQAPPAAAPRSAWVPYAAELKIATPGKPDTFGRLLQDEHGCTRRETLDPDGSPQIVINNFETGRVYHLFRGNWTSKRIVGSPVRRPPVRRTGRQLDPIDGFDVYESEINVRSPQGDRKEIQWVIPALNSLVARRPLAGGRVEAVISVARGPQPPEAFLPPASANVQETAGFGGGTLWAIALQIQFDGNPSAEAVTTQERPYTMRTPSGDTMALVTSIVDEPKGVVRVRILRNPRGGPFNVKGEELDSVEVPLGGSAKTTRLDENFTIVLTRIGGRFARQ